VQEQPKQEQPKQAQPEHEHEQQREQTQHEHEHDHEPQDDDDEWEHYADIQDTDSKRAVELKIEHLQMIVQRLESDLPALVVSPESDSLKQRLYSVKEELTACKKAATRTDGFIDAKHTCKQPIHARPTATTANPYSALAQDDD
jgi:ABC-type Zn2+ transport system substrate-binding protein/surface adhesin